jgi:protein TonB
MKPVVGFSADVLGRWALAAVVAMAMTLASLVGVQALTEGYAPSEEPETSTPTRAIPLAPPPQPEPEPLESLTEAPTAAATAPAADAVPPPAPAAPALAGLAPTAAPGSLALGPIGGLPSVAGLPTVELEELAEDEAPTTPAHATSRPPPVYPALAQRRGLEGYVTLRLRIDERGRVVDSVVVASEPKGVFDAAAKRAVRRYRFSPARAGAKPVASTLQQTIRFELDR